MSQNNTQNFVIRPAKLDDLEQILALAKRTGVGMTSLSVDEKILKDKIQSSVNSFAIDPVKPGEESYFFVLEYENKIIASSAITARIGGFEPFYSYEICKAKHVSQDLNVDKEVEYLQLQKEHNGPSSIGTLFVHPDYRSAGYGKLMSQVRFLFMKAHPERFSSEVIAEMRGYIAKKDGKEISPFWENTVKHFFDMDFKQADYLSTKDKVFIADLMPRYPIYIPLLKQEVIDVIGEVHEKTQAAMQHLLSEGFKKDGHVDIFDAGPRIAAELKDVKTYQKAQLAAIKTCPALESGSLALCLNKKLNSFATICKLESKGDDVFLSKKDASRLNMQDSEEMLYVFV